ncbi:uncharacterized protein LOC129093382 [Anoplopoma fimbria]|uniref:uncharacterized protein LOC129093382 n=1 Tax=Anoplopoma fimbria TaxID=229290 RepID=UPI0023EB5414|nr:uncharacterized protein LOC129093382 [Anoplopoma fimbria]
MMKLRSRLCFLVLAFSSISRGQNISTVPSSDKPASDGVSLPALLPNDSQNQTTGTTPPPKSPQSHESENATDLLSRNFTTQEEETTTANDFIYIAEEVTSIAVSTGGYNEDVTTAAANTPKSDAGHSSWGYVILILIILVIIVLCVILYFLRRVSRTYSFDLHRQVPANPLNEPIGTFEPVYLDDLDRRSSKDQVTTGDLSPPPVSNGTTLQSEERRPSGDGAPQEQLDTNGMETSPTSNTSPSLGDDPAEKTPSPMGSTNMFFDVVGEEQQNENNNNPSVCSSDPFVEINLDEPALCDQLLTSTEAPSSVLPFSPFSFSSSSSSSSSFSSLHLQ